MNLSRLRTPDLGLPRYTKMSDNDDITDDEMKPQPPSNELSISEDTDSEENCFPDRSYDEEPLLEKTSPETLHDGPESEHSHSPRRPKIPHNLLNTSGNGEIGSDSLGGKEYDNKEHETMVQNRSDITTEKPIPARKETGELKPHDLERLLSTLNDQLNMEDNRAKSHNAIPSLNSDPILRPTSSITARDLPSGAMKQPRSFVDEAKLRLMVEAACRKLLSESTDPNETTEQEENIISKSQSSIGSSPPVTPPIPSLSAVNARPYYQGSIPSHSSVNHQVSHPEPIIETLANPNLAIVYSKPLPGSSAVPISSSQTDRSHGRPFNPPPEEPFTERVVSRATAIPPSQPNAQNQPLVPQNNNNDDDDDKDKPTGDPTGEGSPQPEEPFIERMDSRATATPLSQPNAQNQPPESQGQGSNTQTPPTPSATASGNNTEGARQRNAQSQPPESQGQGSNPQTPPTPSATASGNNTEGTRQRNAQNQPHESQGQGSNTQTPHTPSATASGNNTKGARQRNSTADSQANAEYIHQPLAPLNRNDDDNKTPKGDPTGEGSHGGLNDFLYPERHDLRRAKAKLSQRPRWANGVVGNVLNGTLFSNTITQLCIVIKTFDEIDLGVCLIVLIAFSICLQIATGFILVYMTVNQSHYKHPKRVRSLPKVCALLVFSLFLINIAIDCFYLQMTNKS